MLSAGGPGAGSLWLQMPVVPDEYFLNSHFRAASLRRLGALSAPRGATCAIPAKAGETEDLCGHTLDTSMVHPQLCKQGPARMRPHRALAAAVARELCRCGAEVDLERTVVELAQWDADGSIKEAILDLVVTFPGSVQQLFIDVTIRCPHADRYLHAAHSPGEAASCAAREKMERYGASVLPVAMETYGRIAIESQRSLEHLASHAGACIRDYWAAPRLIPTWRATIERVVQFAVADIDLLALGYAVTSAESRIAWGRSAQRSRQQ